MQTIVFPWPDPQLVDQNFDQNNEVIWMVRANWIAPKVGLPQCLSIHPIVLLCSKTPNEKDLCARIHVDLAQDVREEFDKHDGLPICQKCDELLVLAVIVTGAKKGSVAFIYPNNRWRCEVCKTHYNTPPACGPTSAHRSLAGLRRLHALISGNKHDT